MAGYSEKDIDSSDDLCWKPPTEAERKVIQARRDRADRISKIMGSYLLKGYKMLASECVKCGTIELQDKMNKIYCVACEEVDPEIQKDNPALSEKAASSQRAEQQYTSERVTEPCLRNSTTPSVSIDLQQTLAATAIPTSLTKSQTKSAGIDEEFHKCSEVVQRKLAWARTNLETEDDPNIVTSYLKAMTACAEAIVMLKKLSS